MPIFDYQCADCGKTYDVFHKVREVIDDVVCPGCGSTKHTRLISAPNVSVGGVSLSRSSRQSSEDFNGGCCGGGACGIN